MRAWPPALKIWVWTLLAAWASPSGDWGCTLAHALPRSLDLATGGGRGLRYKESDFYTKLFFTPCKTKLMLPEGAQLAEGEEGGGTPAAGGAADWRYGGCSYGSLPGMWQLGERLAGERRWQVLTPGCETRNLIGESLSPRDSLCLESGRQQDPASSTSQQGPGERACTCTSSGMLMLLVFCLPLFSLS
jgi:hypothetical protein